MTRTALPAVAGLLILSSPWLASHGARGEDRPQAPGAPAQSGSPGAALGIQNGVMLVDRARPQVFWTPAGAQQAALQYIHSGPAHRKAMVSLQQCQTCHGGLDQYVRVEDPHAAAARAAAVDAPWVGVSVGPADDVLRSQLKLPEGAGVVVTKVMPDGPARQAGVAEHDILLSVDGRPVATAEALDEVVKAWKPESPPLTLRLLHAGRPVERTVTPTLTARHLHVGMYEDLVLDQQPQPYRIGVDVSVPDETLRRHLRLGDAGLVVTGVAERGPAQKQGVKANDVLASAAGNPLRDPQDLTAAVRDAAESPLELEVLRGGGRLRITVTPEKQEVPAAEYGIALDFAAGEGQPRELTLVRPGVMGAAVATAIGETRPAAGASERLDHIAVQLEQLRAAVESLRADVQSARKPEGQR